jgi:hypothetical protein
MFTIGPQLTIRFEQLCSFCDLPLHSLDEADEQKVLFGWKAYAVCPKCGNTTEDRVHDPKWRRKVQRYIKKYS